MNESWKFYATETINCSFYEAKDCVTQDTALKHFPCSIAKLPISYLLEYSTVQKNAKFQVNNNTIPSGPSVAFVLCGLFDNQLCP